MGERDAWQQGYHAGLQAALAGLRGGKPVSIDNPYDFRFPECGCDIRYPTGTHVLDCSGVTAR